MRWRSSHLDVTPDPYSLHPVELFVPGKTLARTIYISTRASPLPWCLSSSTLSKANANHLERKLLPPSEAHMKNSPFMVLLETPRCQETTFKWQHGILAEIFPTSLRTITEAFKWEVQGAKPEVAFQTPTLTNRATRAILKITKILGGLRQRFFTLKSHWAAAKDLTEIWTERPAAAAAALPTRPVAMGHREVRRFWCGFGRVILIPAT